MVNLIGLALNLPSFMNGQPIPVLSRSTDAKRVSLSQMQCASILANAELE